jgi:predicted nucleic acid-binding protein
MIFPLADRCQEQKNGREQSRNPESLGPDDLAADALIAATAAENHIPLCTGDYHHFRSIRELELSVFRP